MDCSCFKRFLLTIFKANIDAVLFSPEHSDNYVIKNVYTMKTSPEKLN